MQANQIKKVILALATGALMAGCSGASSAVGGGGSSSTYTLSGSLSLGSRILEPNSTEAIQSFDINNLVNVMDATQCGDNYFYQVYCVAFTEPPVSATGNVSCSGATGGFSVAGLPVNSGVGCFIRRASTSNGTYSTLGTLEIPAASIEGSTSTIVGTGDIKMNVSIDTSGTIVAEIASDSPTQPSTSTTVVTDATAFSGIYQISCQNTSGSTEFNQVLCKCMMDQAGAYPDKDTCIAANAAAVSNTNQFVDLSLYQGSVTADITVQDPGGNSKTVPAGSTMYGISVWRATDATTSTRTGGEGFPSSGTMGSNIDFTGAVHNPKAAVGWSNSGTLSSSGMSVDLTGAASQITTAATTGTVASWKTLAAWFYTQSVGFTCSWGAGNPSNDANCMAEFLNQIRRGLDNGSFVLPKMQMERNCGMTGCDNVIANARIFVEGVHFQYNNSSWTGSQNAVTADSNGMGPEPTARHAFEQFEPNPAGGGGFNQRNFNQRTYPCATSGAEVTSALCDQTYNWLECQMNEEMAIRFIPTSTTGTYTMSFETRTSLMRAVIGKSNNAKIDDTDPTNGAAIKTLCEDKAGVQDGRFLMTGVKQ